jgi:uncharacterized protein (DUF3084 family)
MRKLRGMTDSPETEGTGRARFKYLSDDRSPVSLPGNADATPSVIRGGDVVEVNADTAELLMDDPQFELTDEDVTVHETRAEQRAREAAEKASEPEARTARNAARTDQARTGTDGDQSGGGDPS